jgi:hypothetical protein
VRGRVDLLNETPFAARILRREIERGSAFEATLVVKATLERNDRGRLVPAGEQMPFVEDMLETPFGIFHTDSFVGKEGIDVCVLGTVRTESPVRDGQVLLTAQALRSELRLVGKRRWSPGGTRLVPTPPEPFTELPLAYTRAYGGATEHDDETHVWTDNPAGIGYYLSEEKALGQPLPEIELGQGPPVREWSDQPQVAGWGPYPCFWGIRAREGIDVSEVTAENPVPRFKARLNNNAHPALVTSQLPAGSDIRIRGMRPRDIVFVVPDVRPVAEVTAGQQRSQVEGRLDGAFVWVDADRLTLTYRAHFTYPYRSEERRILRLRDAASSNGG